MTPLTDLEKSAIDQWATGYCQQVAATRSAGVLLGGSIARGEQWKHSDLELGLLVDEADPKIPYFNVDG